MVNDNSIGIGPGLPNLPGNLPENLHPAGETRQSENPAVRAAIMALLAK
jgi:hypothetical protein